MTKHLISSRESVVPWGYCWDGTSLLKSLPLYRNLCWLRLNVILLYAAGFVTWSIIIHQNQLDNHFVRSSLDHTRNISYFTTDTVIFPQTIMLWKGYFSSWWISPFNLSLVKLGSVWGQIIYWYKQWPIFVSLPCHCDLVRHKKENITKWRICT